MKCRNHAVCGNEARKGETLCEPCKEAARAQSLYEYPVYVDKSTNKMRADLLRKNGKR